MLTMFLTLYTINTLPRRKVYSIYFRSVYVRKWSRPIAQIQHMTEMSPTVKNMRCCMPSYTAITSC